MRVRARACVRVLMCMRAYLCAGVLKCVRMRVLACLRDTFFLRLLAFYLFAGSYIRAIAPFTH